MARKTVLVTISEDNRDQGKTFVISELPATRAEDWGIRVLLALARSGIQIPENVASMGLAGVAALGLNALSGINFFELKPLLDEMITCVKYVPDPHNKPEVTVLLLEGTIEEVTTLIKLRGEWFKMHTDFLANLMQQGSIMAPAISDSSTTPTVVN